MVAGLLTDDMIDRGSELVKKLDEVKLPVNGAFWFFFPESSSWRLMIASPLVSRLGPKQVYSRGFNAMSALPRSSRIDIQKIEATSDKEPIMQLLRTAVRTDMTSSGFAFQTIESTTRSLKMRLFTG